MKIIGITGGIGSGKSTVSNIIKSKGFPIIDCDEISRNITKNDSLVLREIRNCFGEDIFDERNNLRRKALADIVFANKEKKKQLEKIVTERVINIVKTEIKKYSDEGKTTVFIDAPLLFETSLDELCDLCFVITADVDIRIKRVMKRDLMSREEILERIKNQMPDEYKIEKADGVIDNSRTVEELKKNVERLIIEYV